MSALRSIELFADLSGPELAELEQAATPFTREPGEVLFRQGAPGDALWCVGSGRIALTVHLPGGDELTVAEVGPGEVVGELSLLDGAPRSATAAALESTGGHVIPRPAFDVLRAASRPSACKTARRIAAIASVRLRALTDESSRADFAQHVDAGALNDGGAAVLAGERSSPATLDRDNLLLLPVFRRFSRDELGELLADMHRVDVPRGRVLFREGDPPGSCFVTVRGAVLACVERDGNLRKYGLAGPGRIFGHFALFDHGPRSATCIARERSTLLELERTRFAELFDSTSPVALKFFDAVCAYLAEALRAGSRRSVWQAMESMVAGRAADGGPPGARAPSALA